VKFLFPNSFNVYMHDTPSRNLFALGNRDLSHGCIRVSKPERLGEWVLQPEGWTQESVKAAMGGDERKSIALKEKIPVYIVYLTLFPRTASGGKMILSPGRDVYERDPVDAKTLAAAIPWNQSPPPTLPAPESETAAPPTVSNPAVTAP
jgi:murein L,D-transpeptidase YcbB/YkuD